MRHYVTTVTLLISLLLYGLSVSAATGSAPIAKDDTISVKKFSGKVVITPTNNDSDPDGDAITLTAITSFPSHGTALIENGRISYTPDVSYGGIDSLIYSISDGNGNSDTATLLISVTGNEPTVTLNPSKTYDKHDGWETTTIWDNVGSDGYYDPTTNAYKDTIADYAVNTLGLNRVRLEIKSGDENPVDWWAKFYNGEITRTELKDHFFQKINDNNDPDVANAAGFHFTNLDYQIEYILLPMKNKLNANGEKLYVNICYVDFYSSKNGFNSSLNHSANPKEYAELVHEALKHIKNKYNIVPDGLEIILEPDHSVDWKPAGIGTRIGNCLVETMKRITLDGFNIKDVIAPSNTSASVSVSTLDEMVQVPGVLNYLTTYSYHKYFGYPSSNTYSAIRARAETYNLKTAMLEKFEDTDKQVFDDMVKAHISSYQKWAYATPNTSTYINIDKTDSNNWKFSLHDRVRAMPQIFKNVRLGAREIGAFSSNSNYRAAAYINTNGSYSLLVRNSLMAALSANGLPAGTYSVKSSGFDINGVFKFDVDYGNFTITAGQPIIKIPLTTQNGVVSFVSQVVGSGNAPIAQNDTATLNEDANISIDVLNNDTDADGDTLVISSVSSQASNGTAVIQSGKILYTPTNNFNGNDSFDYTISDGNGGSATATVSVTISPVQDAPVANNDSATVNENTNKTIDVLLNDTDADGDTLTIASISSQPTNGSAIIQSGKIVYTPSNNYNGNDSLSYVVSDGNGNSDTASIAITVTSVQTPPVAQNDSATVNEDSSVNINVLGNDTDSDGDTLAITSINSQPSNGSAVIQSGKIIYTPNNNFNGSDLFSYQISDGNGGSATANVSVTISPVQDAPVANNDSATVNENTNKTIDVLLNDTDADGDTLSIASISSQPSNGSAIIQSGKIVYTPSNNYNGNDSLSYVVSDGNGNSDTASIAITVTSVQTPPVAQNDSATVNEDASVIIDVLINDSDADGDTLSISSITSQPTNGTAVIQSGKIIYTPSANYNGSDTFNYSISDGNGGSDTAIVSITVNPIQDSPVAQVLSDAVSGDIPLVIAFDGTGSSDIDGDSLTFLWDFGDGATSSVASPSHTFSTTGIYQVSLTVSDGKGNSDATTISISSTSSLIKNISIAGYSVTTAKTNAKFYHDRDYKIISLPPSLNNLALITFANNDKLNSSPSFLSFDVNEGVILYVAYDSSAVSLPFWMKGYFDTGLTIQTDSPTTTNYKIFKKAYVAGNITLGGNHHGGDTGSLSQYFILTKGIANNSAPVAVVNASVISGSSPLTVDFDASASYDLDGDSLSYQWIFGDGNFATGATPTNIFTKAGTYLSVVTVSDAVGFSSQQSVTITVVDPVAINQPPVADFTSDKTKGFGPLNVSFDASNSSDSDNDQLTYQWDLGDGKQANGIALSHVFQNQGQYTVVLTVSDGALTSQKILIITVDKPVINESPVAIVSSNTLIGTAPLQIHFSSKGSIDPEGSELSFSWNFGDGHTSNDHNPSHVYQLAGNFQVNLTVTDIEGKSASATLTMTILNKSLSPLVVEVSRPTNYKIDKILLDRFAFIDRSYRYTKIPTELNGFLSIRTANNDKYENAKEHVTFTVNQNVDLYIAYDQRAISLPPWLESFEDTGLTITTQDTAPGKMKIYKKVITTRTITLGGNHSEGDTKAFANYLIIIAPAGAISDIPLVASGKKFNVIEDSWSNPGDSDGDGLFDAFEKSNNLDPFNIFTYDDGYVDENRAIFNGTRLYDIQLNQPDTSNESSSSTEEIKGDNTETNSDTSETNNNNNDTSTTEEDASNNQGGNVSEDKGNSNSEDTGGCSYSSNSTSKDISWLVILLAFLFILIRNKRSLKFKGISHEL